MKSGVMALVLLAWTAVCAAQSPSASPFGITDNSFLVEEAFNQERGIVQNIFVFNRARHGGWNGSFTQEWPVRTQRHQLSYTLPFSASGQGHGIGDVLINYRFQLASEDTSGVAVSPRLSLVLPTGASRVVGDSGGVQFNLPVSKRVGRAYFNVNGGATWLTYDLPVQSESCSTPPPGTGSLCNDVIRGSSSTWSTSPFFAASAIWAARPMFNLLLETYVQSDPDRAGGRDASTTIVPGFRTGWNFGDKQFIVGVGVPVTRGATRDTAVLGYVSYELPFRK